MSIIGLGTDVVEIARLQKIFSAHGERFARRLLSEQEYIEFANAAAPAALLARRFAAKEAAAKALGCGIGAEASFHDLIVGHDATGAPQLVLSGPAAARAARLGVSQTHLSISDERAYAMAVVILER